MVCPQRVVSVVQLAIMGPMMFLNIERFPKQHQFHQCSVAKMGWLNQYHFYHAKCSLGILVSEFTVLNQVEIRFLEAYHYDPNHHHYFNPNRDTW